MEQPKEFKKEIKDIYSVITTMSLVLGIGILLCMVLLINPEIIKSTKSNSEDLTIAIEEDEDEDEDKIENGIHIRTGFVDDNGLMETINNCTNCHSSKLVIQNRMSKERWLATIRWMQKTQNLWDLGGNEAIIVNYLAKNYAPIKKGRRENLTDINWYELEN